MDKRVKINISIAGKSYPMTVDVANEELYRVAAKRLNETIAEFNRVPQFSSEDRLAMAALRYSILALNSERNVSLGDEDIQELENIERRIRDYVKA
ncbi:MAG: cell division protein ZapA [Alistipes sp.]|nr:cell division protein ZapA [Alistipes sp.]